MASIAFIRPFLLLRPQNSSFRASWPIVTTAFHIAQGHYNYVGARDTVLSFGSISDKETNTNAESYNVKPRSVPVQVAYWLLQAGHRYLDVRMHDEFIAGHASGSINIPYMFINGEGMFKNSKFLEEVSSHFAKDDKIIIGCKSGRRSLMAASDLQSAGFTHVTDVAGGYSEWTEKGLPISK